MPGTSKKRPILLVADVARIWSEEAGKPVSERTVHSYLDKSKPADPATGRKAGRYARDPVPAPDDYLGEGANGNQPYWSVDREEELRAWRRNMRGRGAGGGRPRKRPVGDTYLQPPDDGK